MELNVKFIIISNSIRDLAKINPFLINKSKNVQEVCTLSFLCYFKQITEYLERLSPKEDIATFVQMKSSKVRELREQIVSGSGMSPEDLEILLPKKETINIAKLYVHFFGWSLHFSCAYPSSDIIVLLFLLLTTIQDFSNFVMDPGFLL